jgi:seryl-tRNA synthetase
MADTVTQLQDQVNHMAMLMFNSIGTLQRDALPAERLAQTNALSDSIPPQIEIPNQNVKKGVTNEQIEEMTKQLVECSKVIDAEGTPAEQLKRIEELREEHEKISKELHEELKKAKEKLDKVNAEFEQLADTELMLGKDGGGGGVKNKKNEK